jgi:hypothetical protein
VRAAARLAHLRVTSPAILLGCHLNKGNWNMIAIHGSLPDWMATGLEPMRLQHAV